MASKASTRCCPGKSESPRQGSWLIVVVAAVVLFACSPAVAFASGAPVVASESVSGVSEHGATLEAQVNPDGLETAFAFWLAHEVCTGYEMVCHFAVMGPLGEGRISGGDASSSVSTAVTGLEENTTYFYLAAAANSAGRTVGTEKAFRTLSSGGLETQPQPLLPPANEGTPFERKYEAWLGTAAAEGAAIAIAETKRKEEEREANNKPWLLPVSPIPPQTPPPEETGIISLEGTRITVEDHGMALMKFDCTAVDGCAGRLTLTATSADTGRTRKGVVKAKGAAEVKSGAKGGHVRSRTVVIASRAFTVAPEQVGVVKVALDSAGRMLLEAAHGHLRGSF